MHEPPAPWTIWITCPTTPPGPGCQPTVAHHRVRHDEGGKRRDCDLHYAGFCLGCGWIGRQRESENEAAEDAHDHSHPQWRTLPVIEPYEKHDATPQANRLRFERIWGKIGHLFPPDWEARCGPIVTWRGPYGDRHVPGRSPFGGYDMARERGGPPQAPRPAPVQDTLF